LPMVKPLRFSGGHKSRRGFFSGLNLGIEAILMENKFNFFFVAMNCLP